MSVLSLELPRPRWEWLTMKFDGTIGLGSIINLVVMLAGGVFFLLANEHRMTTIEIGQVQIERRQSDQEAQMRTFQSQINQIINAVSAPGKRSSNEFSQTPP